MRSRPIYTRHGSITSNVLLQRCHADAACTSVVALQPQSGSAAVLLQSVFEGFARVKVPLRARVFPFSTGFIHYFSRINGLTNAILSMLKVLASPKYSSQIISRNVFRHGQMGFRFITSCENLFLVFCKLTGHFLLQQKRETTRLIHSFDNELLNWGKTSVENSIAAIDLASLSCLDCLPIVIKGF